MSSHSHSQSDNFSSSIASATGVATAHAIATGAASTGNGTSGTSSHGAATAKTSAHRDDYPEGWWTYWIFASIIGLLVLYRLLEGCRSWIRLRKYRNGGKLSGGTAKYPWLLSRPFDAASTTFQHFVHLVTLPPWLGSLTMNEAFWNTAYLAIMLTLCLHNTAYRPKSWANAFGKMTFAQLPLVVGLAGKNNVLTCLTGIGYEKWNFLHRAAGRVMFLAAWIHAIAWMVIGLHGKHALGTAMISWGLVALGSYTLLTVGSLRVVRNFCYETFLVCHIVLAILYMVGCWIHWPRMKVWVWPAILLFALDRVVRTTRLILINKLWLAPSLRSQRQLTEAHVRIVSEESVSLTVHRPEFTWKAGQHCFLIMPTISKMPFEAHPFTITNAPGVLQDKVVLSIRARDGFTRRLLNACQSDSEVLSVPTLIEGPYGSAHSTIAFDSVVLIVGGSGISFGFAHLCEAVKAAAEGRSLTRYFEIVWMMRTKSDAEFIQPHLAEIQSLASRSNISIKIEIHLTKYTEPLPGLIETLHQVLTREEPVVSAVTTLAVDREKGGEADEGEKGSALEPSQGAVPYRQTSSSGSSSASLSPNTSHNPSKSELNTLPYPSFVTFHRGRPDLPQILSQVSTNAQGQIFVGVCGPQSLLRAARGAVREVRKFGGGGGVISGREERIVFVSETFGW